MKFTIVRRGDSWKVKTTAAAPPSHDYEEDEMHAAQALLMLANGGHGSFTLSSSTATTAKKHQDQPPMMPALPYRKEMSYTCNVCGKSFGSHQALGGHKTSHRPMPSATNAASCTGLHECSFCHETFPSGQALGGHMSKHVEGRKSTGTACKRRRVTSSDGFPASCVPVIVIRDFDLNEMPAPELF